MKGKVIWLTGLSGSGKTTIAKVLHEMMIGEDYQTIILDGDDIRNGLCEDLGFSLKDRKENIRRVSEVCKLFSINGINVITAFISPIREDRVKAKEIIGEENFIEVYVECPIEECEKRDPKGLYKKVRAGEIPNFTGIDSPYEAPENPAAVVITDKMDVFYCAGKIFKVLES